MAGQVQVSHILLMYQGSERSTATRSKEDALSEIGIIKEKIANGEDFAALAAAHSDCPSGRDGGDLGFFSPGAMVPSSTVASCPSSKRAPLMLVSGSETLTRLATVGEVLRMVTTAW